MPDGLDRSRTAKPFRGGPWWCALRASACLLVPVLAPAQAPPAVSGASNSAHRAATRATARLEQLSHALRNTQALTLALSHTGAQCQSAFELREFEGYPDGIRWIWLLNQLEKSSLYLIQGDQSTLARPAWLALGSYSTGAVAHAEAYGAFSASVARTGQPFSLTDLLVQAPLCASLSGEENQSWRIASSVWPRVVVESLADPVWFVSIEVWGTESELRKAVVERRDRSLRYEIEYGTYTSRDSILLPESARITEHRGATVARTSDVRLLAFAKVPSGKLLSGQLAVPIGARVTDRRFRPVLNYIKQKAHYTDAELASMAAGDIEFESEPPRTINETRGWSLAHSIIAASTLVLPLALRRYVRNRLPNQSAT